MGSNSMPDQFDGVPIRTKEYNRTGTIIYESSLSSISNNKISNDKVSIPATYTKQTMY